MILGMESITLEITKYRKISYIVSVRWLPKRRKKKHVGNIIHVLFYQDSNELEKSDHIYP